MHHKQYKNNYNIYIHIFSYIKNNFTQSSFQHLTCWFCLFCCCQVTARHSLLFTAIVYLQLSCNCYAYSVHCLLHILFFLCLYTCQTQILQVHCAYKNAFLIYVLNLAAVLMLKLYFSITMVRFCIKSSFYGSSQSISASA